MSELQFGQFAARQNAAKQEGKNCPVPLAFERVRRLPEFAGLVSGEPISKSDTQLPGRFHPPDRVLIEPAFVCVVSERLDMSREGCIRCTRSGDGTGA